MKPGMLWRALLLAGLAAGSIHSAQAGLFDDDEARRQIKELNERTAVRLDTLESGAAAAQRAQLELSNQLEILKDEIGRLRGQVEVLTYELESAQKRQKDFYVDLDNRLRRLEPSSGAGEPAPAAAPADPAQESKDFESALGLLKGGKFKEAAGAFGTFIRSYPKSSFQPAAHFWAGMSWQQLKEYAKAADLFSRAANQWPDDARAPDALLSLSSAQLALNDSKAAKKTLDSLVARYPKSEAAKVARQKLTTLK